MPDSWSNIAYVAISKKGGSYIQFAARTREIDINEGDRMGHSEPSLNGARIWLNEPQSAGTVTMKLVPLNLDTTSANGGLFQQYRGGTFDTTETGGGLTTDTTVPATLARDEYRVVVLWTNAVLDGDAAALTAQAKIAEGKLALRFYASSCRCNFQIPCKVNIQRMELCMGIMYIC